MGYPGYPFKICSTASARVSCQGWSQHIAPRWNWPLCSVMRDLFFARPCLGGGHFPTVGALEMLRWMSILYHPGNTFFFFASFRWLLSYYIINVRDIEIWSRHVWLFVRDKHILFWCPRTHRFPAAWLDGWRDSKWVQLSANHTNQPSWNHVSVISFMLPMFSSSPFVQTIRCSSIANPK